VAERPGERGGVAHTGRPATMSRVVDPSWVGGTQRSLAGRGPTGEDEPRACASPPGSVGTDEESGDTLSVARVDLKTFVVPDLSVTRLAYTPGSAVASHW
jgi:hypothetical protein